MPSNLVGRRTGDMVLHQFLHIVWPSYQYFNLPSHKMGFWHSVNSSITDKPLMGLILKA